MRPDLQAYVTSFSKEQRASFDKKVRGLGCGPSLWRSASADVRGVDMNIMPLYNRPPRWRIRWRR
jgi:hypothetical protein